MSTATQCPQCETRFRVTEAQLLAHQGMVRCGRCNHIFNATTYLSDDQPEPQSDLTTMPPEKVADNASSTSLNFSQSAADKTLQDEQTDLPHSIETPPQADIAPKATPTLAQQVRFVADEETTEELAAPRTWAWILAALLLLMALLLQVAYFSRVELAAQLPGLKPALTRYCDLLHCTIALPQKADLMSIEASDLEADRTQSNFITVNVLLHNMALYAQAYPHLELTLTDIEDKPIARRAFAPSDYLPATEDLQQGLFGNREQSIKLHLDTTDLKASGYKLFLFYPR